MIRLGIDREPRWLVLAGGACMVRVKPLTTMMDFAAKQTAAGRARDILIAEELLEASGAVVTGLPPEAAYRLTAVVQSLTAEELAVAAIEEWQGVLDADGQPLPVTEANVRELMATEPDVAEDFLARYRERVDRLDAEGNASRPSPTGTSAAGQSTADGAATMDRPAPTVGADGTDGAARTSSTGQKA